MLNSFCSYGGNSGVATHAKFFLRALKKFEPVALTSWVTMPQEEYVSPETCEMLANVAKATSDDPCIGIGSIEQMENIPGTNRFAFVIWEPTVYPKNKRRIIQSFEEVWVPSSWGREVLMRNGVSPEKVLVVPEGVDPEIFQPARETQTGTRPFRFLCVGKWENRKNIGQLVQAFTSEFQWTEPVELLLHCFNPHDENIDFKAKMAPFVREPHPPIRLAPPVDGPLTDLYNSCDAFVLPTRVEGWGLPIMEAMSCGLPVIVTDYSAPVDFVNETNGYPLRVERMVDFYDPWFYPPTNELGKWAQPDLQHLRYLMRHVYQNREEAREKGRRARESVCARWTWDHAAAIAYQRLRPS